VQFSRFLVTDVLALQGNLNKTLVSQEQINEWLSGDGYTMWPPQHVRAERGTPLGLDRPGAGPMVSLFFCPSLVVERQLIDTAARGENQAHAAVLARRKDDPQDCVGQ
jgi:hypothetical protein